MQLNSISGRNLLLIFYSKRDYARDENVEIKAWRDRKRPDCPENLSSNRWKLLLHFCFQRDRLAQSPKMYGAI